MPSPTPLTACSLCLVALSSLYLWIAFSRSLSINDRCAIESTSPRFEAPMPCCNFLVLRRSVVSDGGAWTTSFNLRGTEVEAFANSFAEATVASAADEAESFGFDFPSSALEGDVSAAFPDESCLRAFARCLAFISALKLCRTVAFDAWIADRIIGRISSSTLLRMNRQLLCDSHSNERGTYRLKCCIGSPGWIFRWIPPKRVPPLTSSLSTFPRFFSRSPLSAPSRCLFNFHSSRVLTAFKTRDADLGITSLFKARESFPGAKSIPLRDNKCFEHHHWHISDLCRRSSSLADCFALLWGMFYLLFFGWDKSQDSSNLIWRSSRRQNTSLATPMFSSSPLAVSLP